jgi:hypothetical protein
VSGSIDTGVAPQFNAVLALNALPPADLAKALAQLQAFAQPLQDLKRDAGRLAMIQEPVPAELANLQSDLAQASVIVAGAGAPPDAATSNLDWLCRGFGALTPPFLESIQNDVESVSKVVTNPQAATVIASLVQEANVLGKQRTECQTLAAGLHRSTYEMRAIRDTDFAGRVLEVIIRELNLYAISPVAMFDAARLGPARNEVGGVRYGLGPGIRLSLANWNLNIGYSWTLRKRPGDSPGALNISITVTDLFR